MHAIHITPSESARAAHRGAIGGLFPITGANLGDGIFDTSARRFASGRWGYGSDRPACVNAAEELMMLEYSQRLHTRQRNLLAIETQPFVATAMTLKAVGGGAQASGRPVARLVVGQQAHWIVLNATHPSLDGLPSPDACCLHMHSPLTANRLLPMYGLPGGGRFNAGTTICTRKLIRLF